MTGSLSQEPLRYKRKEDCPARAKHTPEPTDYCEWFEWADKKAKTHAQHRCPTCGFWAIWKREPTSTTDELGSSPASDSSSGVSRG